MGDNHRFEIVSNLIARNFKPCRIADVAGGCGILSLLLSQKGFNCTIIDPRKTDLPREFRSLSRKNKIQFDRRRSEFNYKDSFDYDLIVGLHPDGATEQICYSAKFRSCVLIPCCNHWDGTNGDIISIVNKFFLKNGIDVQRITLPMSGQNTCFIVKRKGM